MSTYEHVKTWRKKYPEKLREQRSRYYRKHREWAIARSKQWKKEHPEECKEYARKSRRDKREFLEGYKRARGCNECGESDYRCLEVHHADPSKKGFDIGTGSKNWFSIKNIKKEIKKCIVICANCHRKIHYPK